VTLVIAQLCCDGSAVMCSDSQSAWGSGWKSLGAKKIHVVSWRNPPLVIGTAGDTTYGGYTVRRLSKLKKHTIGAVEETVGKVYEKFIDLEVRRGSKGLGYTLSVILQEEGRLRIYKVSEEGVSEPVDSQPYLCIGSGAALGDWIMSEFGGSALDPPEALELASYAIWTVGSVDPDVGGQVQAARVSPPGRNAAVHEITGEAYADMVEATIERRELLSAFWRAVGDRGFRDLVESQLRGMAGRREAGR